MRIDSDTSPENLYPFVLSALRSWNAPTSENPLKFLLLVREQAANGADPRKATGAVLQEALASLQALSAGDAALLQDRFLLEETAQQLALNLRISVDQFNRRQKAAVLRLSEVLLNRELELRRTQAHDLKLRLPPRQYSRLFGIRAAVEALDDLLHPGQPPWVVALSGIGGIGKTALARHLALRSVPEYGAGAIHWISIPTTQGPQGDSERAYQAALNDLAAEMRVTEGSPAGRREQVRRILASRPGLVVIDNLESEAHTTFFLEQLTGLGGPSRFLVTTRANPPGVAGARVFPLRELEFKDAADLIRSHSREIGPSETAIHREADCQAIYDVVGGNPLALKLVVGMTTRYPLSDVLADLGARRLSQTVEMYDHVYRRAWEALSLDARELLEGMLLVSESGAGPQQLQAISGLPEERFWPALDELLARTLLEGRGSAAERRYGIHPLTRAFLRSQITGLP